MNADSIKIKVRDVFRVSIDADEDGFFHLIAEGEEHDIDLALGHIEAEALYEAVKSAIEPWLRERDDVQSLYQRAAWRAEFRCNPDESGGYDTSDPKHPDFHSVHADLYDSREGK